MQSLYYPREARCKICMSPLRDEMDQMLLSETLKADDTPYKYDEIVPWARERGLETSIAALSRHKNNHLHPAIQAALETERMVAALETATGRKLSLQQAVVNVIASKALRMLNETDLADLPADKALTIAVKSVDAAAKLARAEQLLTKDTAAAVGEKLKANGLSDEIIREIEEQILGLRR